MEQIRVVKEMRNATINNIGLARPRYMVWENVAGAFSSNGGKDFQAVLSEIVRIAEPEAPDVPMPKKDKWPHSGELHDEMGRWSVAWRTHDAQYWGVPQRRKRIAILFDGGGTTAAKILFEQYTGNESRPEIQPQPDSLPRNIEQSGTERKDPSATVREGATNPNEWGGTLSFQERAGKPGGGKGILIQNERTGAISTLNNQSVLSINGKDVAPPLDAHYYLGADARGGVEREAVLTYGISSYDSNAMKSPNPNSGFYEADTARTLDNNGGSPACNQGGMAIVQGFDSYNLAETGEIGRCISAAGGGLNEHTPVVFENHCQDSRYKPLGETCSTLATNLGTGGNNQPLVVKQPVCIGNGQADQAKESELVGALNCMHDQQAVMTFGLDRASYNQGQNALFNFSVEEEKIGAQVAKGPGAVCAVDCRNGKESDINATLQADADHNTNSNNVCRIEASVRRLTPMECERLQGFPDGWTDIGEWVDSKGKKHKPADAPRYKALGNSIALPFWFWLLRRISAQYTRRATLGSLFDGIGGFPLCWEAVNGKGTARWASEIEEFPIAVTKRRFPE